MKAYEIGSKKIVKFILYSLLQVFYHNLVDHFLNFPQVRSLILKIFGAKIGRDSVLMNIRLFNIHHFGPKGLKIGRECFIGDETLIDLYDKVIIGNQVTIAQRVTLLTHNNVGYADHPLQKHFPKFSKAVTIEDGCVIGTGAILLPGITIGTRSFVAAGSVVTKNVPPSTLVGGVPAKVIRKLN